MAHVAHHGSGGFLQRNLRLTSGAIFSIGKFFLHIKVLNWKTKILNKIIFQEAEKKGATATEYGLVFGIFELVVFLISPIYGQYINRVGAKRLFNAGIFTTGISAILFGFLDRVDDRTMFIGLAFAIRIVEALGNAAFLTASFR